MKLPAHKKSRTFITLFFCAILLCTAGCGKSGSRQKGIADDVTLVKVAFWGSPEEIEIITECINGWQEKHPTIKIRFEHAPYGGYVNKILTRIAGNAAPDIICTEVNNFVTFQTKGVLEDLTPFVQSDTSFNRYDFFPEVMERFTREGKLYAIARDTAPFACMFYNKDLFDASGIAYPTDDWTWNDFLTIAQALTKRDEKGGIQQYGFYGWAWQNFVYGNGGNLVDDIENPTRCTLDDPRSVEGLQFYADLFTKHKVMPTPIALSNMGMGIDYMFASGKLAMFLSGIWDTPGLRTYDFNWDVVMFPKNKNGVRRFGTGGSGYCILKSSQNKEAAWEVVKALTAPAAQVKLAEMGLSQPARKSIAESEHFATHPGLPHNKGMLNEAVHYAVYDPFHTKWPELDARFITPALDQIKNGRESVAEAIARIVPEINKEINK